MVAPLGSYERTLQLLDMRVTPEQHAAMRFLEREGLRFCVEFGTDNAVAIAREKWNTRRRERRQQKRIGNPSKW